MKKVGNFSISRKDRSSISQHTQDNVYTRQIIKDVISQRAKQQQIAIDAHYENFYLYRKGRIIHSICPCYTGEDPLSSCSLCYGEGELPPFNLQGCQYQILFNTNSTVATLNMQVDRESSLGVPGFKLINTAYNGRIDSDWIDVHPMLKGSKVELWSNLPVEEPLNHSLMYTVDGLVWKDLENLDFDLSNASRIKFRLQVFRSESLEEDTPTITGIHFRYKTQSFKLIKATSPQWSSSIDRTTLGLLKLIEQGTLSVQCDIKDLQTGDFFHHIGTGERFRVTGIDSMEAKGTTFDWQLRVRRVQSDEILTQIR